ncbi:MAG: DUF4173 domain-containing protein, partial [Proteobacteria bacterium]|nr:DUF4173 domain-containing protein [Pseudomonadota bacterium]
SETARRPGVRRLVVVWVVQNLFLVASTMLRILDYIEAYSLTPLRIAALAWMGLVPVGLALICWRMLRAKSTAWLVNANAVSAGLVLVAVSVVDLNGASAAWNVRHAKEAGGRGAALDVCYLRRMGGSAVVPLARLEAQTSDETFRHRLSHVRAQLQHELALRQSDWRRWTWRGARQLAAARAVQGRWKLPDLAALPNEAQQGRACDGSLAVLLPAPGTTVPIPPPTPEPPSLPPPARSEPVPLTTPAQP